jgi:hypothetical protein
MSDVVHRVSAPRERPHRAHLVPGAQFGTVPPGRRQIGVVEAVLGTVVAAEVALTAQPAGTAADAVQVVSVGVGHRQTGPGVGARYGDQAEAIVASPSSVNLQQT